MTPELKALFDPLTRLQKGVCLGILEGMEYWEAYKEAGGVTKTKESAQAIVSRMLTDAKCKAFMDAANEEAVDDTIMTRREAMQRLTDMSNVTIRDIANFREIDVIDAEGNTQKQAIWSLKGDDEISDAAASIISEVSAGRDGLKFKTHSQLNALKQLGEMRGWEAPKQHQHTGANGGPIKHQQIQFIGVGEPVEDTDSRKD